MKTRVTKILLLFALLLPAPGFGQITAELLSRAEDKVSEHAVGANGRPDFHIKVSGLKSAPAAVVITSGNGATGVWALPANGINWVILAEADHFWFDYFAPADGSVFTVQVTYADGSKESAIAAIAAASLLRIPPETQLVDAKGQTWTRGPQAQLGVNYTQGQPIVNDYVLCAGVVYGFNVIDKNWLRMDAMTPQGDVTTIVGPNDPCAPAK